jgi:hypothetical protein
VAGAVVRLFAVTWPINASWLLLSASGAYLDLFAYHEDTGAGGLVDGLMHNVLIVKLQNRLAGYQHQSRDVKRLEYAWEACK